MERISALPDPIIREAVTRALGEDIGPMDITSHHFVPSKTQAQATMLARQEGVLAGLPLAIYAFRELDPQCRIETYLHDGQLFSAGTVLLKIEGNARAILSAERTALNFVQQLSGVATLTHRFVQATAGTATQILDTRKTVPGLRLLQKYAVVCGGGKNHRMGLYDHFLIKDNHLTLLTTQELRDRIKAARQAHPEATIEIEASSLEQVKTFSSLDVDVLLLDNMDLSTLAQALQIIGGRIKTEASGNMTLDRVAQIARLGVDYISVGALTHSAPAVDISLEFQVLGLD
ncbi:MAG: carboxylating nicotinate-nucleotide diphosphorylase [Methylacidiphilales bacterium]|nr:carboxylating nicotinate-nucleotide diphosphorylase [Candidatus Methylacidiphilales bacterium]MDW8349134.1 carboxylating nicotinate-nucleotide diphosphorylase [Verrucomicrobiae bacterium]